MVKLNFEEKRRQVEETVTIVSFEVVGPHNTIKNWLDEVTDYVGQFIHNKVKANIESDGVIQFVKIEIAKPLTVAEKTTINLLINSLGTYLLSSIDDEVDEVW